MWFFLLASCSASPLDSGDGAADTGEPAVAWEHRQLTLGEPVAVVSDGERTWEVSGGGRVTDAGAGWVELSGEGALSCTSATTQAGVLWAGGGRLGRFDAIADDATWETFELPDQTYVADLVVQDDGSVLALYSHVDCDICKGEIVQNDLLQWDGSSWTTLSPPLMEEVLRDLARTPSGRVLAVGDEGRAFEWTGTAWEQLSGEASDVLLVVDSRDEEILAAGLDGAVLRGPVDDLTAEVVGDERLVAAELGADGSAWVLGSTRAWVDSGGGWVELALPEGAWVDLEVDAAGVATLVGRDTGPVGLQGDAGGLAEVWRLDSIDRPEDCWVDEEGTVWLAEGWGMIGRWSAAGLEVEQVPVGDNDIDLVAGSSSSDVVIAGYEALWSWDGSAWTEQLVDDGLMVQDLGVADDGTAFAVGRAITEDERQETTWLRRLGGVWERDPVPLPEGTDDLRRVQLFAADDAVVLDGAGQLLRWDGSSWSALELPGEHEPIDLWGTAADDLYLVEADWETYLGTLLHWDGSELTEVDAPSHDLRTVAGTADGLLLGGYDRSGEDPVPTAWERRDGSWAEVAQGEEGIMTLCPSDTVGALLSGEEAWVRRD